MVVSYFNPGIQKTDVTEVSAFQARLIYIACSRPTKFTFETLNHYFFVNGKYELFYITPSFSRNGFHFCPFITILATACHDHLFYFCYIFYVFFCCFPKMF